MSIVKVMDKVNQTKNYDIKCWAMSDS